MTTTSDRPARRAPRRAGLVLTGALHLAVLWPYSASGLLAPGWAVLGLLLLWAALAVGAVAVHRRWGVVSALVPLGALALWSGALVVGERLLGWTG